MRKLSPVLALTAALTLVFSVANARPVKMEYKFRPGQIDRYKFVVTTSASTPSSEGSVPLPANAKMVAVLKQKTLSVMPDGAGKVQVTVESAKLSMPGMSEPMNMGDVPPMILLVTKSGQTKTLSAPSAASGGLPGLGGAQFTPGGAIGQTVFPTGPVSVGQTWTQALPSPMSGKILYKLVSESASVGKQKAAKITYSVSGKLDMKAAAKQSGVSTPGLMGNMSNIPFTGRFAMYFSPDSGKMVRTNGNMRMKMSLPPPRDSTGKISGKPMKMDLNMNMEMFLLP